MMIILIGYMLVMYHPEKNRNRCLKAYKENGKTKYAVI